MNWTLRIGLKVKHYVYSSAQHPISKDGKILAYSPVNIVGKILGKILGPLVKDDILPGSL